MLSVKLQNFAVIWSYYRNITLKYYKAYNSKSFNSITYNSITRLYNSITFCMKMVLQASYFEMGNFLFKPEVNRYGHWAIFVFSTYNPVMHEVFFFHSRKGSLIKEFGWKNSLWHNTLFRKQKSSHKKFKNFYFN